MEMEEAFLPCPQEDRPTVLFRPWRAESRGGGQGKWVRSCLASAWRPDWSERGWTAPNLGPQEVYFKISSVFDWVHHVQPISLLPFLHFNCFKELAPLAIPGCDHFPGETLIWETGCCFRQTTVQFSSALSAVQFNGRLIGVNPTREVCSGVADYLNVFLLNVKISSN